MDPKTREFCGPPFAASFGFPDVAVHPLFDGCDEGFDGIRNAFHLKLHPSIGKIFHPTSHIVFPGDIQGGISEADSLNPAGKKHGFVMNVRHCAQGNT